jgi:uncharacterized protein (TIGR03435 family)
MVAGGVLTAGQSKTPTADAETVHQPGTSFDVVSIKPSDPKEDASYVAPSAEMGLFRVKNFRLGILILMAYYPPAYMRREYLQNAPDWIWQQRYDFVGKVDEADRAEWGRQSHASNAVTANRMQQAMLQAALEDRFKLAVHRVSIEIPGYALVADAHGLNKKALTESRPENIPTDAIKIDGGAWMKPYQQGSDHPTVYFYKTSMKTFTAHLCVLIGATIEDRTAIEGEFDFALVKWPDAQTPQQVWDLHGLGLKLVPIKIPSEAVVIDHIERPTPD